MARKRSQAEIDYYASLDQGKEPDLTQAHLNEVQAGTGGKQYQTSDLGPGTVKPQGVWETGFTGIKPPKEAGQEVLDQWYDAINQPFGPGGEVITRSSLLRGGGGGKKNLNPSNPASQSGALRRVVRPVKKF